MPLTCPIRIRNLTRSEFDEVDRIVMGCAFETQNELGRLCEERVYENVLAIRLREAGLSAATQVPLSATHDGFEKIFRLDLVADSAIYELKTALVFSPMHDAQALNYAMLLGINHAKLVNFRTEQVEGRLRYNTLMRDDRQLSHFDDTQWRALSDRCEQLHQRMRALMEEWGTALLSQLYEEALIYFFGGATACVQRLPVVYSGTQVGTHVVNSHADGISFVVTSLTEIKSQRAQLEKMRRLLGLRAIQWLNVGRGSAQIISVT